MSGTATSFEEAELWEKAEEHVRAFGSDAPAVAAREANQRLAQADLDGVHHWCIIGRRTKLLLQFGQRELH